MRFINKIARGMRATVIIPASAIDSPLIAPWISPISRALAVPMACATVPRPMPWATGLFILNSLMMIGASIMPTVPRTITDMVVRAMMPPYSLDRLIAIAVVTDSGKTDTSVT